MPAKPSAWPTTAESPGPDPRVGYLRGRSAAVLSLIAWDLDECKTAEPDFMVYSEPLRMVDLIALQPKLNIRSTSSRRMIGARK